MAAIYKTLCPSIRKQVYKDQKTLSVPPEAGILVGREKQEMKGKESHIWGRERSLCLLSLIGLLSVFFPDFADFAGKLKHPGHPLKPNKTSNYTDFAKGIQGKWQR